MKKNTLSILALSAHLLAFYPLQAAAPDAMSTKPAPMPVAPGANFNDVATMSPEQLAEWEKEVTKEIDQYVSTLSPEEQAQFHKEVEELTNVMSKMSPDELVQFIDTMLTEDNAQQPMPVPTPQPVTPVQPVEEEKTTIKPQKEPELSAHSIEGALALIDDLIIYTERFLRTSTMIPELPGTIEKWVSKNKIREWKSNLTWEILKGDIESLNKLLNQLKERDPKTKKYLYLSKLLEQESLYNNLIHIKQALTRHVPHVQAPAFGLGTVTPESHEAIKQVLTTFAEAIYTLHVPTDVTKLLGTSQAREKELKEEEEKSRKQALDYSKRPQVHEGKRETVQVRQSTGGYYSAEQPSYPSYGYPSSGSYSHPADSSYYGPNAYSNKPTAAPGNKSRTTTPGKESPSGAPAASDKDTKNAQAQETKKATLDDTGKSLITKIDKALEKFNEAYDNSSLNMIQQQLTRGTIDSNLQDAISKAQTHLNNALDLVKKLKTRARTNQSPAQAVKDALHDVVIPSKGRLDTLIKQLGTLRTTRGVVVPPAVDALYTTLTDFNKEVGASIDTSARMAAPAAAPAKPGKPTANEFESEISGGSAPATKKDAPQKAKKEDEGKRVAAPESGMASVLDKKKDALDEAASEAKEALEDPKITALSKHLASAAAADIQTARAVEQAVQKCSAIKNKARTLHDTLNATSIPQDQKKKVRHMVRDEYKDLNQLFVRVKKELQAIAKIDVTQLPLDKQYAFFGQDITQQEEFAKNQALQLLYVQLQNPKTITDLIKAIESAETAIKDI